MANIVKYNLAKVGSDLRVIFSVIINHNETKSYRGKVTTESTISKTNKGVTSFYDVTMYPYITLDFTSFDDVKESIYSGVIIGDACKIKLNKYNLFLFINILRKVERGFVENKDLYYYSNGKLVLNKEVANNIAVDTSINNVRIIIYPTVVSVGPTEKEHEGISLSLHELSNITYLTYTEIGYLRYLLDKVDLDLMAINIVQLIGENKVSTIVHNTVIDVNDVSKTITKPEEIDNSSYNNKIIEVESVIPNI